MADNSQPTESFTRKRSVVIGAALMAMLFAAILAWFAINTMPKESTHSNLLPIRSVTFVGELTRVDRDALKGIAGGIETLGGSMLRTDLNQVKAVVKQIEWVRDAEIRRRFPATLEISIEEHKPFARWGNDALVNIYGEVFEAAYDGTLPVFTGPAGTTKEIVMQYNVFRRDLAAIGRTPVQVRLSPRRAWQVRLDNGLTLEVGREQVAARVARFLSAYPQTIAPLGRHADYVDLRYANGFAVRVPELASTTPKRPGA